MHDDLSDDLSYVDDLSSFIIMTPNKQKQLLAQRNQIWLRAALSVLEEEKFEIHNQYTSLLADLRYIDYDTNCLLKLANGCKKTDFIKLKDLPSSLKTDTKEKTDLSSDVRDKKEFLKQFANK